MESLTAADANGFWLKLSESRSSLYVGSNTLNLYYALSRLKGTIPVPGMVPFGGGLGGLCFADVFRLWAAVALFDFENNFLSFGQALISVHVD